MSLQEKINEILKSEDTFISSLSLEYKEENKILLVHYSSCFGFYDVYNIKEGINQREKTNHVKYKYRNGVLTILVDKKYGWSHATTESTDILRLPNNLKDLKVEFF